MKILPVEQIRALDEYTIEHEPIASINLMERASRTFAKWFTGKYPDRKRKIFVCSGPGNNGGDGLAIARLLSQDHYDVKAYLLRIGKELSADCEANKKRLITERCCPLAEIEKGGSIPVIPAGSIVIDAIFGSGLSRPVEGYWADFIAHLNKLPIIRVAVDIPSGMFADRPTHGVSILAEASFTFELPKLGFLFPENQDRVGEWEAGSIGLHPAFIQDTSTPWHLMTETMVASMLKTRKKFDHKGIFGHALLVAGGYGKAGAAVLAARAIARSGAGLVSVHIPGCAYQVLQTSIPEAMVEVDADENSITGVPLEPGKYTAIGMGCGIGTEEKTFEALSNLLEKAENPVVLDADALNLIAAHPELFGKIPDHSILTPHPKEFQRLFGKTGDSFERSELQRKMAQKHNIYLILKGAYTAVACPDGSCYFNSTGNPGMATGGSGDVLTGILTGLLAQGYSPRQTALLGVYLHGLAGDFTAASIGWDAMIAGDIIDHLASAFQHLRSKRTARKTQ